MFLYLRNFRNALPDAGGRKGKVASTWRCMSGSRRERKARERKEKSSGEERRGEERKRERFRCRAQRPSVQETSATAPACARVAAMEGFSATMRI